MNNILRHLPVILAMFLLLLLFQLVSSTARAEQPLPTQPAPPFLEPAPTSALNTARTPASRLGIMAVTATPAITNVLASGDELIHGLIYFNGFVYGSTRGSSPGADARILKINPTTLSVVGRATLTGLQNAEDIEAAAGYLWAITYMPTAQLVRIDPASMAWSTVITFNSPYDLNYGTSLDYAFGYLWASGLETIVKIDISQPLNPTPVQMTDYHSLATDDFILFHAMTHDATHMWLGGYQYSLTPPPDGSYTAETIVRFEPANTASYVTQTITPLFPDDVVYLGSHFFASTELVVHSDMYKFANSVTTYTTTHVANTGSYGTFAYPMDANTFYGVYTNTVGTPGTVIKFDLNMNDVISFTLPTGFGDPSEMAFDPTGNMYVVTWGIPTHIAKYSSPAVTNLAISKSGSHSHLSWTHLGSVVHHYEVWASTQPYFTPGDVGSTKLSDVNGPFGTTMSFTDPTATIGNTATNRFYVVRTVSTAGLLSAISNRVGEFDYALTPGGVGTENFSVIALPLDAVVQIPDADTLATYIGTGVTQVLHWSAQFQTFEVWFPQFRFGTNFSLEVGQVYWIALDSTGGTMVSFVGGVPASGSLNFTMLGNSSACLLNDFSLPFEKAGITSASALSTVLGDVEQTLSWSAPFQTYEAWFPDFSFGTDFTTQIGYPYHACLRANTSWP